MRLALLLLILLALPPAAALPAQTNLQTERVAHCLLPDAPACPLGHDPGPTGSITDDTIELSTVMQNAALRLGPTAATSKEIVLDYRETSIEHHLFLHGEALFHHIDAHEPEPLRRIITFHTEPNALGNHGLYVRIWPYRIVPVHDENRWTTTGFFYIPGFIERDRIYPLMDGGTAGPLHADTLIDLTGWTLSLCPPEEQALAPTVCATRHPLGPHIANTLKQLTPNLAINAGLQHATIEFGQPRHATDRTFPTNHPAWSFTRAPEASPLPAQEHATKSPSYDTLSPTTHQHPTPTILPDAPPNTIATSALTPSAREPTWPLVAGAAALLLAIALYRRLRRDRLLDQPNRKAIHNLVRQHPGITIGEACKALGLSYKTAMHHTDLLIDDGHLLVQVRGRQRRLYPNTPEYPMARRHALDALRRPSSLKVLHHLQTHGPTTTRNLATEIGISRTATWQSLRDLHQHGWITLEGQGPWTTARATTHELPALAQRATARTDLARPDPPNTACGGKA